MTRSELEHAILARRLIRPNKLRLRVNQLPRCPAGSDRVLTWIDATVAELMAER